MRTKLSLLIAILLLGAAATAYAVQWPGWRIPVGWEFMRDEAGELIEEEVQDAGYSTEYILDERDLGPRLPRS